MYIGPQDACLDPILPICSSHIRDLAVFCDFLPALASGCPPDLGTQNTLCASLVQLRLQEYGPLWDHLPGNMLFPLTSQSLAIPGLWTQGLTPSAWS